MHLKNAYAEGVKLALTTFNIHDAKTANIAQGSNTHNPTLTSTQSAATTMPASVPKPITSPTAPIASNANKANLLG